MRRFILTLLLTTQLQAHTTEEMRKTCYDVRDPLEAMNRRIFLFNQTLFRVTLLPTLRVYERFTTQFTQDRISSLSLHASMPLTMISSAAAKDKKTFVSAIERFLLNSIVGLGGLFDFASEAGLPRAKKTFVTNLAEANADYGKYLVIPILGPSTTRDLLGTSLNLISDPIRGLAYRIPSSHYADAASASLYLDNARTYDTFKATFGSGVDGYSGERSAYLQNSSSHNAQCMKINQVNYDE